MNERTRKDLLKEKEELNENLLRKEQILKEIDELVSELKETKIVSDLKVLGEVYKDNLELQKQIEKRKEKKLVKSRDICTHPILCRMGYVRHIDKSSRVYKTDRENAEYAKNRCIECGKIVFSKDNDHTDDWDSYIMTPESMGQYGEPYVKRNIVEPTYDIKYKDLHEYYEEIMLDYPQKEVIQKIKQKIKEKK